MRHPFNQEACTKRLIKEYNKYGNLVIGYDFDNTIYDYHNEGGDYSEVIGVLKHAHSLGFVLCLYTAEPSPEKLEWKIKYAQSLGLTVDYVNDSPLPCSSPEKPFFNLLLDDRAGLEEAYKILCSVIEEVETLKSGNLRDYLEYCAWEKHIKALSDEGDILAYELLTGSYYFIVRKKKWENHEDYNFKEIKEYVISIIKEDIELLKSCLASPKERVSKKELLSRVDFKKYKLA